VLNIRGLLLKCGKYEVGGKKTTGMGRYFYISKLLSGGKH
jgi:hypothetical protein